MLTATGFRLSLGCFVRLFCQAASFLPFRIMLLPIEISAVPDSSLRCAAPVVEPPGTTWQQAMKQAVRDSGTLCRLLQLPHLEAQAARAAKAFPLFAPLGYVARMRTGDPSDPLLRQVLPLD